MNNGFIFLIAGEPSESKVAIAQKIAGDYALGFMGHYPSNVLWRTNDVIICDAPEDVIEAKKSYRGYSDILTILVSDMRHEEWEGTSDIADLVVDPDSRDSGYYDSQKCGRANRRKAIKSQALAVYGP